MNGLRRAVLDRIKRSALWQHFDYLCNLLVVSRERDNARSYEDLPVGRVEDPALEGRADNCYGITLAYGHEDPMADPFNCGGLEATWREPEHFRPLERFLKRQPAVSVV